MSGGRTVWWAKDSAWWRRERIVELGEEFGADGPAVLDWLCCEAKAQNDGGMVKTGFRSVSRGCFVELVTVRHVVSRAVTLGLLHDFEDADGLFTCRISGWVKDQERGRAADRQALQRAAKTAENGGAEPNGAVDSPSPTVTSHGLSRPVTSSHADSLTGQDRREEETPTTSAEDRADVDRLCSLLAELMVANDPKAKVAPDGKRWRDAARLLLDQDGRSLDEAERVIRFSQADDFWRSNVLSMPTLRDKFPQLLLKMRQRPNGRAGISASDQAAAWLSGGVA